MQKKIAYDIDGTLIWIPNCLKATSTKYRYWSLFFPSTKLLKQINPRDLIITGRRDLWYVKMYTKIWALTRGVKNKIVYKRKGLTNAEHKACNIIKNNIQIYYEDEPEQAEGINQILGIWGHKCEINLV